MAAVEKPTAITYAPKTVVFDQIPCHAALQCVSRVKRGEARRGYTAVTVFCLNSNERQHAPLLPIFKPPRLLPGIGLSVFPCNYELPRLPVFISEINKLIACQG